MPGPVSARAAMLGRAVRADAPVLLTARAVQSAAGTPAAASPAGAGHLAGRHAVLTRTARADRLLTNPGLARVRAELSSGVLDLLRPSAPGYPRNEASLPVSEDVEPADTTLFEDPADPARKLYLPRYRLREQSGRYEIRVAASGDGGWRLSVGLERLPAPELGDAARGAAELPHQIAVFFRYRAGPANAIEKRVDFTEIVPDDRGVTVATRLALGERDSLLQALQSNAGAPQLVVRRAIEVAARLPAQNGGRKPQLLVRREAALAATARPLAREALDAEPLAALHLARVRAPIRPPRPEPPPTEPPPQPRYHTVRRALDDLADPDPFVLDPQLHRYFYEGAAGLGGSGAAGFRRIVVPFPEGAAEARFHAYFQDQSEPSVFYYLPDGFKLARRDVPPFFPQMVVRIAAPDGALEQATVTVDYVVEPSVDPARLLAALAALRREIPAAVAPDAEPELRPLQATARLRLWLPGPAGAALQELPDVGIDLANGFLHSVTLPLDAFRQVYAAAYSRDATSLFTGQVLVETGLSTPEPVPLTVRFADAEGEVFDAIEQPEVDGASLSVRLRNAIESPLRIAALPVRLRRGDAEVEARIAGATFELPVDLQPGEEIAFRVSPAAPLGGEGPPDAIFDTSRVEVLPDPERILPVISDTSVPAQYLRQIEVMTLPELLGETGDPQSVLLINVEFKGGGSVRLSRETTSAQAQVRLPLLDLLLGRDVEGRYAFKQQVIRRNGARAEDAEWREATFGLLVVPVV